MNPRHAFLAAACAALLGGTASAQTGAPLHDTVQLATDSGRVSNPSAQAEVVISFPVQMAGATWLRLYFEDVELAGDVLAGNGAILRITSWLDGDVQELNARHLAQWQNSTAYFNGDTVQVEVLAQPNTGDSRVKMRAVDAGLPAAEASQCGQTDDRILSSDPRSGRLLPIGCTGWLIDDCASCALTAGHCTGGISVLQFNVPLSNPNGSINNPPAADQYAVDAASIQSNGGQGVGNDWGYFGTFPNPNTGLTAAQAQGSTFTLGVPPGSTGGNDIRITGYGTDSGTSNQVQQTHVGPLVNIAGTQIGYVTDTTGGNSGSPVIHEQTGNAVGIHTHGGCSTSGGNNWGTQSTHPNLQAALADPQGVCLGGGISVVGQVPTLIVPGSATTLQINAAGTPVSGTQFLHYRASSLDLFTAVPMTPVGASMFEADLPAFACGDEPDFYFSSTDGTCGPVTLPVNAPIDFYSAGVGVEVLTFADNFESDTGWATEILGATTGQWDRGTPINDASWAYDPESDADGSGQCYMTQNDPGNTDVDNGSVRLTSPALDFTTGNQTLFYSYYLNLTNEDGTDRLLVEMAESAAGPWVTVASHSSSNGLNWTNEQVTDAQIMGAGLSLTAGMRVRFTANDTGTQSIVEAGVDGIKVGALECGGNGIGTSYCGPAVPNSTGMPGSLSASGSDVASDNNVTLLASDLPANQFGFFLNSLTQGFQPGVGGSQGNLCLDGQIGRYNMPVLNSGPGGQLVQVLDLTNTPTPMGATSIVAGQTWNFQAWHRDLNPGATSNFTDAVSIDFQ